MSRRECPVRPGPAHQFATDLRALRAGTGLTYRALARRAGYSYSTLSAAASGEALPTLEVTLAYVGACGGDMAAWEQRWHALAAEMPEPTPGDAMTSQNNNPQPLAVPVEDDRDGEAEPVGVPERATDTPPRAVTAPPLLAIATPGATAVISARRRRWRWGGRILWLLAAALPVAAVVVISIPQLGPSPTRSMPTQPAESAPSTSTDSSSSSAAHSGSGDPINASGPAASGSGPALAEDGSRGPEADGAHGSAASTLGPGPGGGPTSARVQLQAEASASAKPSCATTTAGCASAPADQQINNMKTATGSPRPVRVQLAPAAPIQASPRRTPPDKRGTRPPDATTSRTTSARPAKTNKPTTAARGCPSVPPPAGSTSSSTTATRTKHRTP